MTDRTRTDDPFELWLHQAIGEYADDRRSVDPYAVADAMLQRRSRRRTRVAVAGTSAVLAAAVLAGLAIGGLMPKPEPLATSPSPSAEPTPTAVALPGQEAPDACGFPAAAALSFAGRSTTAALGVNEVVGDPMSDEPADIYITRDQYDQGELRGRLVCAIFPGEGGEAAFVEVTVHPEDGGRFSSTPFPSSTQPPAGISRADAVSIAHDLLPATDGWEVRAVEAGPLAQAVPGYDGAAWADDLPEGLWVWRVFLVSGDRGTDVVIDYVDGSIHGTIDYIVN